MAEWLYETGIGENRAALVEDNEIIRAEIERPHAGPCVGSVFRARFDAALIGRRVVQVRLEGGGEAFLDPAPSGFGSGGRCTVEVVREPAMVRNAASRVRRNKAIKVRVVPDDTPLGAGPGLRERLNTMPWPVRDLRSIDADALEAAGWGELVEEARSGEMRFSGGRLLIELTQAMTVIDVDGDLPADALAVAGATTAARAIGRLRLGGPIAIDLPTSSGRQARLNAADAFDRAMVPGIKFERTAVNGWGLLHVITQRKRASLMEVIGGDEHDAAALMLYRQAERASGFGSTLITANSNVVAAFSRNGANDLELAARRGGEVTWEIRNSLPTWGGFVHGSRDQTSTDDHDLVESD